MFEISKELQKLGDELRKYTYYDLELGCCTVKADSPSEIKEKWEYYIQAIRKEYASFPDLD